MNNKIVKRKKSKIIKTRLFIALFSMMFIISLFTGIKAFAKTNPFSLTNATIEEKSDTVTGSIQSFDSDQLNNDITFHKLNDYVVYKLVIKSNLSNDITILSITDDNNNEYLVYEYDKHENEKFVQGSSMDLLVKVIYKNELTDITNRDQIDNVRFTIKYSDGNEDKEETIIINPTTGDNIQISYILLLISSIGLVVCLVLDNKKKISVFIITGIILSPITIKASTIGFNIFLKTELGLYDKMVVTYEVDGETKNIVLPYGEKIELEEPTKGGYIFKGWKLSNGEDLDENTILTDDLTVVPVFEKIESNITINVEDENVDSPYKKVSIDLDLINIESDKVLTEYSLDDGKNWNSYTKDLFIDDNLTIKFRTKIIESSIVIGEAEKEIKNIIELTSKLLDSNDVYEKQVHLGSYSREIDDITLIKLAPIEKYEEIKNGLTNKNIVSVTNSETPTYMWIEEDGEEIILYYYSDAKTIYLNEDSSEFYSFYDYLKEIDFSRIDTSKVVNMESLFESDNSLTSLDLSSFDTSNVTNMSSMFSDCPSLESINLSSFNTSKVTNMDSMFSNDSSLTILDISSFDLCNVTTNQYMFSYMENIETIYAGMNFYTDSKNVFLNSNKLVGGNGTSYSASKTSSKYAKIDNPEIGEPGYFTEKNPFQLYKITLEGNGIEISNNKKYVKIGNSLGTIISPTREGFDFIGWFTDLNVGIQVDENYVPEGNITLYARWREKEIYSITFDYGSYEPIEVMEGNTIGTLPEPKKDGYDFDGWYLENNHETKVTSSFIPTSNRLLYSKWTELEGANICTSNKNVTIGEGIVCKRAISLHQDKCTRSSYGCYEDGYYEGGSRGTDIITYGQCGTTGELNSGDAFTCDVNGDGAFDGDNERFYFVSDYYNPNTKQFESDTAVLINSKTIVKYAPYDENLQNYNGPISIFGYLPTTSEWSNVSLKNSIRKITYYDEGIEESNTNIDGKESLLFDYSGKAARLIHVKEILSACNIELNSDIRTMSFCNYFFENTNYSRSSTMFSDNMWTETPHYSDSIGAWTYTSLTSSLFPVHTNLNGVASVHPVIEISKNKISY